jgi:branched-chain amino acid transport system substrate-binding protein
MAVIRVMSRFVVTVALLALLANTMLAQEELKIGGIGALSGGGTAWGLAIQRGIQLAIDEEIAAGGLKVGGRTYKPVLIMFDDQFSATGGRTAAERLVNLEKVKFIIGPHASPAVLAALPITTAAKVIFLSDGFAPAILKNDFHSPYNFRMVDSTVEFGPPMVEWLRKNYPKLKKVALVVTNDATGQSTLLQLAADYKANGVEVWSEMFDRGEKEFTPLLTRMIAQHVDLFDLDSNSPGDAGLMVKQARAVGYKGLICQIGGPAVEEIISVAGSRAEGFISFDTFDFSTPEGKKFEQMYHKKWSGVINAQTPEWYNAAKILFEALRRAGTLDTDKVRDVLEHLGGYQTSMYGPVVWGGKAEYGVNHQLLLPFWIVEVKGGKEVIRERVTPKQR